jgi:cell surface protein SprA
MGAWSGDGQLNFENLYNKSKYLKDVNRRYAMQQPANLKFQPRTFSQVFKLEKDKKLTVNHRLGSDKFDFSAKDKNGKPVLLKYKTVNPTTVELTPDFDMDSVQLTIVSKDPNYRTAAQKTVDFTSRFLMMLRRASVSYRQTNSMTLPGFHSSTGIPWPAKGSKQHVCSRLCFCFRFLRR